MKKRRILLALLALALAMTIALPAAMAYFTANARAEGSRVVLLGSSPTGEEVMAGWQKQLTIRADEGSYPMYIRAQVFSSQPVEVSGNGWTEKPDAEGWYYYTTPLANLDVNGDGKFDADDALQMTVNGDKTAVEANPLLVQITTPYTADLEVGEIPKDFEVTIVYESAPVKYKTDGTPYDCNDFENIWKDNKIDRNQSTNEFPNG